MGNLDKRFLITVNLNDSSVDIINESMKFYNTDKNIANFYVRINNNLDGFTKYVPKADATKYKVKVTALKPKTKMFRELLGTPTNDLKDETCAIYKFELPSEFTDQIGDVYCETTVTSGDEELTADYFKYKVKESVLTNANKEIINSPDLPVLKSLLKEVQKENYINDDEISDFNTFSNNKINNMEQTINYKLDTKANKDEVDAQFQTVGQDFNTQLEQKANLSSVFSMANLGQDVKTALTGGSVAVIGKNMILSENVVDKQIRERCVSFIEQSSNNLFDKDYFTSGIITETGTITGSSIYCHSDYIKVNEGEKVTITTALTSGGCTFDLGKNVVGKPFTISSITRPYTFTVPSGVSYIKFNIGNNELDKFAVFKGEALLGYERPSYELSNKILIDKSQINNFSVDKTECNFIDVSINIFDKTKVSIGLLLNTGILDKTKTDYYVSDFIKVSMGDKITVSKAYSSYGAAYDKDKNFISGALAAPSSIQAPYTFTITNSSVKYIRLNLETSLLATYMVVKGESLPTTYEKNEYKLNKDIKIAKDNIPFDLTSKWSNKKCVTFGDSITWYDKQTYNANTNESGIKVKGYQSFLEEYLGLIVNNQGVSGYTTPQICTKVKAFDFTEYDLVTIMSGTNDFRDRATEQIGEIQQIGSAFNESTFIGAYQSMIESILSRFPKIRIQIFTPFMVWQNNIIMQETYINAVKNVGNLYGIPVLDLYHNSGINSLNKSEFIVDDTSKVSLEFHPSTKGYERLSLNCIVPFVNNN